MVLWNFLEKGRIGESKVKMQKEGGEGLPSTTPSIPCKAGTWPFSSCADTSKRLCSPEVQAGLPRAPGASCIPTQIPSSQLLLCPRPFLVFHASGFPCFQLLPQGLSPQLRHPHRPDPALGVDLLPGPAPLCPLHTPTLPLASLPLQGHSLGGLFLPLVGFLPPTKDCPGDRRTSELAIPSSRLC